MSAIGFLQGGSMLCTGLWIAALATQHWHVKTYYLGFMQYTAQLKMNLVTYSWHCLQEAPTGTGAWDKFVRSFCGQSWMAESQLTELSARMCAVEEQSMGFLKVGCNKAQIVAYISMGCMSMIGLSMLFTICAAVFLTMDPGGKPVAGLFMAAPILQLLCLVAYVATTYDLSDLYDVDGASEGLGRAAGTVAGLLGGEGVAKVVGGVTRAAGGIAINDIDEAITFGYSFFIAVGAMVCNIVLAWCAWLFVGEIREQAAESWAFAKDGGQDNGTFQQDGQWDQQQQGWDQQQPPQQWAGQAGQWGGAAAPPGAQWTTTTTQWTGAGAQPAGFGGQQWG